MESAKKFFMIMLTALILGAAFFPAAHSFTPPNSSLTPQAVQTPVVNAFFFYGDGCSHCEKVIPLIDTLQTKYPELNLARFEIYNNASNRLQFENMSRMYGIASPGVPLIFIGNTALRGDTQINNRFEAEILIEKQRLVSCNGDRECEKPKPDPGAAQNSPHLSLRLVISAALVDSLNPCGLSVLIFLLIPMASAGSRRRILLAGGAYIAAMFVFHLLVGIGLFSVFSLSGFSRTFAYIGGFVALLLGIITIADVLRNKETFLLSIPESQKGLLGNYIRRASVPAAFFLGLLAGILGFSCTGGIYISILGLMGKEMTIMSGLPWLVIYNLVYILPLVLITLVVAFGISPERFDTMRAEYKRALRLAIGLILLALGAVILLGWLG